MAPWRHAQGVANAATPPRQGDDEETTMTYRTWLAIIAMTALSMSSGSAEVFDYAKYPNLKGVNGFRSAVPAVSISARPGAPSRKRR